MKAVVVQEPTKFGVETVPDPVVEPEGLLLQVHACGLCGSDLRTLRMGHRKVTLPWIIGHEICGTVVEKGSAYQGQWQIGDRLAFGPIVYCGYCDFCQEGRYELCENYREIAQFWPGGFADFVAVPPEAVRLGNHARGLPKSWTRPLRLSPSRSRPASTPRKKGRWGWAIRSSLSDRGRWAASMSPWPEHTAPTRYSSSISSMSGLHLAEAFEPDATINVAKVDLVAEVRRLTDGKGADVIVTATPAPIAQVQAVEMARKGGRILLFGGLPKDNSKPGVDMNIVHYNALHLIGTTIFAPRAPSSGGGAGDVRSHSGWTNSLPTAFPLVCNSERVLGMALEVAR